jgi:peptidyl-prolyl cis-trans isomerase D
MLIALRERITGYIAWIFVILITIPFMLWGVQEYFGMGQEGYAIKVNGEEISLQEFDQAMTRNRQELLQSFNGRVPPSFDLNAFVRQQTVNQLLNRELIDQLIENYNYRVSPADLADAIAREPVFQRDGRFDHEVYTAELRSRGFSPRAYEQAHLQEVLSAQIQEGIQETAFTTRQELEKIAKLRYQERGFDFIRLPREKYSEGIKTTDEQAEAYYDEYKEAFVTEEQVSVDYVEVSLADLAGEISVNDELLRQLYKDAVDTGQYQTEETRNASHILISVPADADESVVEEKRKQAETVLERLKQGEDFATVAKAESEDPGSAAQGGSLGDVTRGVMVKPFEDSLFALEEGQLSEVVKTGFGFHIIKVNGIKPAQVKPFEEVRAQIEQDYRNKQAESVFLDKADMLATLSFENPHDLTGAAEQIGEEIKQSGFFSRSQGAGIANHPEVREAAFSDSVLLEGRNSDPIEINGDHIVALRLRERQPSRQQTLAEARKKIDEDLIRTATSEKLAAAAETVAGELLQSENPAALAKEHMGEYKSITAAKRSSAEAPREILEAVFKLPAQSADNSDDAIKVVDLANGDKAVVRLKSVTDGDIEWLEAGEMQGFRNRLVDSRGRGEFIALMEAWKASSEIIVNPELQQQDQ